MQVLLEVSVRGRCDRVLLRSRLLGLADGLLVRITLLDAATGVGQERHVLLHSHVAQLVIARFFARSHIVVTVAVQVQIGALLDGFATHG